MLCLKRLVCVCCGSFLPLGQFGIFFFLYILTIIPGPRVGYELVDSQRGVYNADLL